MSWMGRGAVCAVALLTLAGCEPGGREQIVETTTTRPRQLICAQPAVAKTTKRRVGGFGLDVEADKSKLKLKTNGQSDVEVTLTQLGVQGVEVELTFDRDIPFKKPAELELRFDRCTADELGDTEWKIVRVTVNEDGTIVYDKLDTTYAGPQVKRASAFINHNSKYMIAD